MAVRRTNYYAAQILSGRGNRARWGRPGARAAASAEVKARLTPEERSEKARKAAQARWAKARQEREEQA